MDEAQIAEVAAFHFKVKLHGFNNAATNLTDIIYLIELGGVLLYYMNKWSHCIYLVPAGAEYSVRKTEKCHFFEC